MTASGPVPDFVPETRILDIPFLFRDKAHARAVLDGPTGHVYSPAVLLTSKAAFDSLPAEDKKHFIDAAAEGIKANRARVDEDDARGVADLKSKGMQVIEVDKSKLQAALTPVFAEFGKQFGQADIDRIRNAK
jgi:TRAP-type C4-dicarboxylate transport system substrate-binding protein